MALMSLKKMAVGISGSPWFGENPAFYVFDPQPGRTPACGERKTGSESGGRRRVAGGGSMLHASAGKTPCCFFFGSAAFWVVNGAGTKCEHPDLDDNNSGSTTESGEEIDQDEIINTANGEVKIKSETDSKDEIEQDEVINPGPNGKKKATPQVHIDLNEVIINVFNE